jgi:hypothetical protein
VSLGCDHVKSICDVDTTVADSPVGAPGVVGRTRTEEEFEEYEPVPTELTAATLKIYDVLLVSPVTVALVEVLVPSANVVQVDPLFEEYWIT